MSQKISKEKKNIFIRGDFDVDLLNYDKNARTNKFPTLLFLLSN